MLDNRLDIKPNILVDMDSIFDTRLPVVYALSETELETAVRNGYHRRVKDVFGIIPYTLFKAYYDRRNKYVLKLARATPMIELVKEYCIEAVASVISQSSDVRPKLVLNTHPYDLNNDEKKLLMDLLRTNVADRMDIEVICISNKDLKPSYISKEIGTFIKYDMLDWLEYHNSVGALSKCPLLTTSCVCPLLSNGNVPSKDITQEHFDGVRSIFGPITHLVMLQARLFSAV